MMRIFILFLLSWQLIACASVANTTYPATASELQQGKRDFDGGYYRSAMRRLLPLACNGNAEAQYAVGYMYYYGYGVAQDTDVGAFWIERSARQNYPPAVKAMENISKPAEKRHRVNH
jgi:TPR repeat protein